MVPLIRPSSRRVAVVSRALVLLLVSTACARAFNATTFKGSTDALYVAAVREYEQRNWDQAIAGFERLTLELPARDTLLPRSHYWLGSAHGHRNEHLLAAQAFARVTEGFPDAPLADEALYHAARSYHKLWRKPTLDAQYGQTAMATYRLYLAMYPNGVQRPDATRELARLEEAFATKDYQNGMFYRRRRYHDSAIIYFRNVVQGYPQTTVARAAYLRLVETYREIRYADDARDACTELQRRWADDPEVRLACPVTAGAAPVPAATTPAPADSLRRPPADTTAPPPRPPAT